MRGLEWAKSRISAEKVEAARVINDFRAQEALVKIIWSGLGKTLNEDEREQSKQNKLPADANGQWDMTSWDYLTRRLREPGRKRTVYAKYNGPRAGARHDLLYTKMRDVVDRSKKFDARVGRYVSRNLIDPLTGEVAVRGRDKPEKLTIKKTHVSVLPADGQMTYCQGIDPSKGTLAKPGVRNYDQIRHAFPGCQVALMFSASPTYDGKVGLCNETDLMGRRYPWLDSAESALHRLRDPGTGEDATSLPDMISFQELQRRLRRRRASDSAPRPHNDVMFKASKHSVSGVLIPGTLGDSGDHYDEGVLGAINGIQKKCYLLETLGKDLPIFYKSPISPVLTEVTLADQWGYLYRASHSPVLAPLVNSIELRYLALSQQAFTRMVAEEVSHSSVSQEQAQRRVIGFLAKAMHATDALQAVLTVGLDHSGCLECLLEEETDGSLRCRNTALFVALLQCGATTTSLLVKRYIMQEHENFRVVLPHELRVRLLDQEAIRAVMASTEVEQRVSAERAEQQVLRNAFDLLGVSDAVLPPFAMRDLRCLATLVHGRVGGAAYCGSEVVFEKLLSWGASTESPLVQHYVLTKWAELHRYLSEEQVTAILSSPVHQAWIAQHWTDLRDSLSAEQRQVFFQQYWSKSIAPALIMDHALITDQARCPALDFVKAHQADFALSEYQRGALAHHSRNSKYYCYAHLHDGHHCGEYTIESEALQVLCRKLFMQQLFDIEQHDWVHVIEAIVTEFAQLVPACAAEDGREETVRRNAYKLLLKRSLASPEYVRLTAIQQKRFIQRVYSKFAQDFGAAETSERIDLDTVVDSCLMALKDRDALRLLPSNVEVALITRQLLHMNALDESAYQRKALQMVTLINAYTYQNSRLLTRLLMQPKFTLELVRHDALATNKVMEFMTSAAFDRIEPDCRQHLCTKFAELPWQSLSRRRSLNRFGRAMSHLSEFDHDAFLAFVQREHASLSVAQLGVMARCFLLSDIRHFALVLERHEQDIAGLNPLLSRSRREVLPALQRLIRCVRSLEPTAYEDAGYLLDERHSQQLKAAIATCYRHRQSLDAKLIDVLKLLERCFDKRLRHNHVVELGHASSERAVALPKIAFDVLHQQPGAARQLDDWRKAGYDYFREMAWDEVHADVLRAQQQSVEVYSTVSSRDAAGVDALLKGLDRKTGYSMNRAREKAHTKRRVICSDALMHHSHDNVRPIGIATLVAPNLSNHPQYGNAEDLRTFIQGGSLNEAAYYKAVFETCRLAFYALEKRAQRLGKPSVVISPLLGIGAYLRGQPDAIKRQAIKAGVNAMVAAFGHASDGLSELHLCAPIGALGTEADFEAFAYIQQLQRESKLSQCPRPFVVSESNVFELAANFHADADAGGYDVALLNPGSDHVPGGGCYNDRARVVKANKPGKFSARAKALEEQLAHVTNFMYSQCAGMNTESFTLDRLHAVRVSAAGHVDSQPASYAEVLDVAPDSPSPVHDVLHDKFDAIYNPPPPPPATPAYDSTAWMASQRRRAAAMEEVKSTARTTAVAVPKVPKQARATVQVTADEYKRQLRHFVAELGRNQSCFYRMMKGNKFASVEQEIKGSDDLDAAAVTKLLAKILGVALTRRGCSSFTDSASNAMLALDGERMWGVRVKSTDYPALALVLQHALGQQHELCVTYHSMVEFCVSQLPDMYQRGAGGNTLKPIHASSSLTQPLLAASKRSEAKVVEAMLG